MAEYGNDHAADGRRLEGNAETDAEQGELADQFSR